MRFLMRLNAEIGTARKADVKGYYIGGKTGTAEKVINGRYAKKRVLTAFTAILPADHPQYQLLIMLDEPQSLKETYASSRRAGNAVPTGGAVIARIAPILGIEPALRFAAVRPPYSCGIQGNPVRRTRRQSMIRKSGNRFFRKDHALAGLEDNETPRPVQR